MSYNKSFDLPVTIIRPFNTFGPRQSTRAIIPSITQINSSKKFIKLGNLSPTRISLMLKILPAHLLLQLNAKIFQENN